METSNNSRKNSRTLFPTKYSAMLDSTVDLPRALRLDRAPDRECLMDLAHVVHSEHVCAAFDGRKACGYGAAEPLGGRRRIHRRDERFASRPDDQEAREAP